MQTVENLSKEALEEIAIATDKAKGVISRQCIVWENKIGKKITHGFNFHNLETNFELGQWIKGSHSGVHIPCFGTTNYSCRAIAIV